MASDPTAQDMRDALSKLTSSYELEEFDIEEAIYWFSNDYHGGQSSNLYSALSASRFRPGLIERGPSGTMAWIGYDELTRRFVK